MVGGTIKDQVGDPDGHTFTRRIRIGYVHPSPVVAKSMMLFRTITTPIRLSTLDGVLTFTRRPAARWIRYFRGMKERSPWIADDEHLPVGSWIMYLPLFHQPVDILVRTVTARPHVFNAHRLANWHEHTRVLRRGGYRIRKCR
ncbi:unnamed protein product, partial [Ectocarpus sp. 12 AP-2014]